MKRKDVRGDGKKMVVLGFGIVGQTTQGRRGRIVPSKNFLAKN